MIVKETESILNEVSPGIWETPNLDKAEKLYGNMFERKELNQNKIKGYYIQPPGPNGIAFKRPFYRKRINHKKAFNSEKELGLQVKIQYIDSFMWINIEESWLA
jgi:hypothetical protein